MIQMTGLIFIILLFSIPITRIITDHIQKQTKLKAQMIRDEIELEKIKHENYLLETETLKLQLEKERIHLESPMEKHTIM